MTVAPESGAPEAAALFRSYSGDQPCKFPDHSGNETQGARRPPVPSEHYAPARHRWLDEIQRTTAPAREKRAKRLLERAADIAALGLPREIGIVSLTQDGFKFCPVQPPDVRDRQPWEDWPEQQPVTPARVDVSWWTNRAEALRVKIQKVKECGNAEVVRACNNCGCTHDQPIRCGDHRLCLHCRKLRMLDYQERFERAHNALDRENKRKGYHRDLAQHGYRWSARFITLTLPHIGIAEDLEQLAEAWPRFLQRLRQHLEKDRGLSKELIRDMRYCRVLEVTPGGNGFERNAELREAQGHCHMHVYLYGPFIERDLIALYWGRSLAEVYRAQLPTIPRVELLDAQEDPRRRARLERLLVTRRGKHGRPLVEVFRPVVDVRQCKGSAKDIARELAKYLIKDGERDRETGELVHVCPDWFAAVYAGLLTRRSIGASRYFWLLDPAEPRSVFCPDCGSPWVSTYIETNVLARGPPAV